MKILFKKIIKPIYVHSRLALLINSLRATGNRNAVFIWIPKSAGRSVFQVLQRHGCVMLKNPGLIKCSFPQKGIVTFGHVDYRALLDSGYVSHDFDRSSFKFCFSRNPYDRAVSLFFFLKRINRINQDWSFLIFCRYLRDNGYQDIGLYNSNGLSQCNPQIKWVENNSIDYYGKVETLEDDLNKILSALDLPPASPPHANSTSHMNSREYYCRESKNIIEMIYEKDFQFFGYDFKEF